MSSDTAHSAPWLPACMITSRLREAVQLDAASVALKAIRGDVDHPVLVICVPLCSLSRMLLHSCLLRWQSQLVWLWRFLRPSRKCTSCAASCKYCYSHPYLFRILHLKHSYRVNVSKRNAAPERRELESKFRYEILFLQSLGQCFLQNGRIVANESTSPKRLAYK